jgi:hypothetical protein
MSPRDDARDRVVRLYDEHSGHVAVPPPHV